jgi:hypothetical protein
MRPRLLSAKSPRANPCNRFPKCRNLDAIEKTTWNIVNWNCELRVASLRFQECEDVYPIKRNCAVTRPGIYLSPRRG